jgi:RimJ/RimL family protein N-acetyltransferase
MAGGLLVNSLAGGPAVRHGEVMDLRVDGLRLRPLRAEDAALVVEATSGESEAALWGPTPAGSYTLDDATAHLNDWESRGHMSMGVIEGGRLLGAVGVMPDEPGSAEVCYWVRPEERGHGVGRRAVVAVSEWALSEAALAHLWLEINPGNEPSLRLAEAAGYRFDHAERGYLIWVRTART